MAGSKKYREEEIARIFEDAAKLQSAPNDEEGLTLEELQSIGAASGLSPEAIAAAAKNLHRKPLNTTRQQGSPYELGIRVSAQLPGKLSQRDWEDLLIDIRGIFNAPGKDLSRRNRRHWKNGNLQIVSESGTESDTLLMSSLNGRRRFYNRFSIAIVIVGIFALLSGSSSGGAAIVPISLAIILGGIGFAYSNRKSLKKWAHIREGQMVKLAERASQLALTLDDNQDVNTHDPLSQQLINPQESESSFQSRSDRVKS